MPLVIKEVLPPISLKTLLPCLLWYLVSSITSQLTRLILVDFSYPLFLSQFQYLISGLLSFLFIQLIQIVPNVSRYFPTGSVPLDSNTSLFNKFALIKILPLALFQFVGKYLSLKATSLIPLPMVASIKTLSPMFIISGYKLVYRVKIPLTTYLSLVPLLFGVMFIISSETSEPSSMLDSFRNGPGSSEIKGLVFCVMSMIIFACQNIYGKQLITWNSNGNNPASMALEYSRSSTPGIQNGIQNSGILPGKKDFVKRRTNSIRLPYSTSDLRLDEKNDNSFSYGQEIERNSTILNNPFGAFFKSFQSQEVEKPDKLTVIFYCSAIGFVFSFCGFLANEASSVVGSLKGTVESPAVVSTSKIITIMVVIVINSFSHFLQTLLAFYILGSVSAVSYSIASMMKRIIIIFVSIAFAIERNSTDASKSGFTRSKIWGLLLISVGLYCYDKWGSKGIKQ